MPPRGGRAARGGAAALTVGVAALITVTACTSPSSPPGSAGATPSATAPAPDAGPVVPADSTLRWHSCADVSELYLSRVIMPPWIRLTRSHTSSIWP